MQYETTPGVWILVAHEQPTDGCVSYTIPAASAGNYNFRGQYNGNAGGCGQNVCNVGYNDFTYTVNVIECGCEYDGNTFTGTADAGSCDATRGATYTLCSEDGLGYFKIQGGLTNFTGADAVVTVTGGTSVTMSQHTPGGSSNRIITVEGGLNECSCVSIYVTWNSSNTGGIITGQWSAKDHVDLIPGTNYTAGLPCVQ
jgi:hypothetical protein